LSSYLDSALRPYSSALIDPLTGLPRKQQQQSGSSLNYDAFMRAVNTGQGGYNPSFSPTGGGGGLAPALPATPDYAALISGDPYYAQAKLDFGAQGVSDASQRAALTQRGLTQFGQVPDFNGLAGLNQEWLNTDVTPEARQLAQRNTDAGLSIVARQDKMFKDQLRQIKNSLAARGALRSGESGFQLQEAQLGRDQARFDTTAELVEFLSGLQAGFAERQRVARQQLGQTAIDAEGRVRAQYPMQAPTAPTAAPAAAAPGELLSPWRDGYVDEVGNREQQQLAAALRRYIAA
jgi:hypothetical protein